jgi:hypothetical protein
LGNQPTDARQVLSNTVQNSSIALLLLPLQMKQGPHSTSPRSWPACSHESLLQPSQAVAELLAVLASYARMGSLLVPECGMLDTQHREEQFSGAKSSWSAEQSGQQV